MSLKSPENYSVLDCCQIMQTARKHNVIIIGLDHEGKKCFEIKHPIRLPLGTDKVVKYASGYKTLKCIYCDQEIKLVMQNTIIQ